MDGSARPDCRPLLPLSVGHFREANSLFRPAADWLVDFYLFGGLFVLTGSEFAEAQDKADRCLSLGVLRRTHF